MRKIDVCKKRRNRVLHTGYQYEGRLLTNHIDTYYLNNKHIRYIVSRLELVFINITKAVSSLENFFNIAEESR